MGQHCVPAPLFMQCVLIFSTKLFQSHFLNPIQYLQYIGRGCVREHIHSSPDPPQDVARLQVALPRVVG